MTQRDLYQAVFRPRSVAIVGASDDRTKTTARPLAFLRDTGWEGRAYPVNPVRETVLGEKSYPSIAELPEIPDHVFVLAAADIAVSAVEECARLGVPVVTIMADGFVETDPSGAARTARLAAAIQGTGTRVLGPSSLGIANYAHNFVFTANAAFTERDVERGGVFVASQSGSVIGAVLSRCTDMGIGLHSLVSTGGEADLSLGELCLASLEDPQITSYALFLENLHAADDLRRFAVAAAQRGKPIAVYKLGRTQAGAELSVSHTGALAGDDDVASAFFADLGIARLRNFEALLEGQLLLLSSPLHEEAARAPRIAVVSTTGGGGAMMVDCLAAAGAIPQLPSPETCSRLEAIGIEPSGGALIDLTLAGTRYDVMKGALDILSQAPEFDAIVAVPGSSARFHPDLAVAPIADSAGLPTPIAAFVMPAAEAALKLLRKAGVASFRTPESCADAMVAALTRRAPSTRETPVRGEAGVSRVLDEGESTRLLARSGVRFAASRVIDIDNIPSELPVPGPVAVKVLSADIPHKSDVGGVKLGIENGVELAAAVLDIRSGVKQHLPEVCWTRALVQQMVTGVGEVLIGYRRDPDVGAIVVLAAGGVLAELYQDRAIRLAPVTNDEALQMISEVTALQALSGYRGLPRGDLEALAAAIVSVSRVSEHSSDRIEEAEINPVMVLPPGQGVVAVDALVRVVEGAV